MRNFNIGDRVLVTATVSDAFVPGYKYEIHEEHTIDECDVIENGKILWEDAYTLPLFCNITLIPNKGDSTMKNTKTIALSYVGNIIDGVMVFRSADRKMEATFHHYVGYMYVSSYTGRRIGKQMKQYDNSMWIGETEFNGNHITIEKRNDDEVLVTWQSI